MAETLVKIRDLRKHYPVETGLLARLRGNQRYVHAVDGIDLDIQRGEIIGIAGESGCGKTTAARCLTLLEDPSGGEIRFLHDGVDADIGTFGKRERKEYREDVQLIYQDPYESINDRFTIRKWVREPLQVHGIGSREEQETKVVDVLGECGLSPPKEYLDQFPHELSGGQRQRVAIARTVRSGDDRCARPAPRPRAVHGPASSVRGGRHPRTRAGGRRSPPQSAAGGG